MYTERTPCKEPRRRQPSTRQGVPKAASSPQKPGERQGADSPSGASEGINVADTLISDYWTPEL